MLSFYRDDTGKPVVELNGCTTLHEVKTVKMCNMNLTDLDLQLFKKMPQLEELDLSRNKLKSIPADLHLPCLMRIDCSNNQLTDVTFVLQFPKLEEIKMKGNQISFADNCIISSACPGLKVDEGKVLNISALNEKIEKRLKPLIEKTWELYFARSYRRSMHLQAVDIADLVQILIDRVKHADAQSGLKLVGKFRDYKIACMVKTFLENIVSSWNEGDSESSGSLTSPLKKDSSTFVNFPRTHLGGSRSSWDRDSVNKSHGKDSEIARAFAKLVEEISHEDGECLPELTVEEGPKSQGETWIQISQEDGTLPAEPGENDVGVTHIEMVISQEPSLPDGSVLDASSVVYLSPACSATEPELDSPSTTAGTRTYSRRLLTRQSTAKRPSPENSKKECVGEESNDDITSKTIGKGEDEMLDTAVSCECGNGAENSETSSVASKRKRVTFKDVKEDEIVTGSSGHSEDVAVLNGKSPVRDYSRKRLKEVSPTLSAPREAEPQVTEQSKDVQEECGEGNRESGQVDALAGSLDGNSGVVGDTVPGCSVAENVLASDKDAGDCIKGNEEEEESKKKADLEMSSERPPTPPPVDPPGSLVLDGGSIMELPALQGADPLFLLRCHSAASDPKDVYTQVWKCAFEPDPYRPGDTTNIVATCGGPVVCLIDCMTGLVSKRYKHSDPKEDFFALAWTTFELGGSNSRRWSNILAVAGSLKEIRLFHPEQLMCYTDIKAHTKPINCLLFHPQKSTWLFSGSIDGNIRLWDIGIPTFPDYNVSCSALMTFEANAPVLNMVIVPNSNFMITGCEGRCLGWKLYTGLTPEKATTQPSAEFQMPMRTRNATCVVDGLVVIAGDLIASKCAGQGFIVLWRLRASLVSAVNKKVKPVHVLVKTVAILDWSSTENFYMGLGTHTGFNLLTCGDDQGQVWVYNLQPLLKKKPFEQEIRGRYAPSVVLHWPAEEDESIVSGSSVNEIIVNASTVSCGGNYLVAVTNTNHVSIWTLTL